MISFDKIDQYDWLYDLYMNYLCVAHNYIYYRHFYILNKENIPPKGQPTIVIANHQNGLMDALAILHTMFQDRRQPVFIARGDIFKKDSVARILRFLKIMPTFRSRDGNRDDIRSNLALYNRAAKVLKAGGTIVIFPEATHQHGHYMNTFKKGFCRIAFSAEEINDFKLGVQVLPLNIHYSNYFNFRSDLMVTVGEPFTFDEFFELYKESPNEAYLALNDKARARVKELTPDIDIPEYLNEIEALTQMMSRPYLKKKGLRPNFLPNQKDAAMTIIANLKQFQAEEPDAFTRLMDDTRQYSTLLKEKSLYHTPDWPHFRDGHPVPALPVRPDQQLRSAPPDQDVHRQGQGPHAYLLVPICDGDSFRVSHLLHHHLRPRLDHIAQVLGGRRLYPAHLRHSLPSALLPDLVAQIRHLLPRHASAQNGSLSKNLSAQPTDCRHDGKHFALTSGWKLT